MEQEKTCPKCGGKMVIGQECTHKWKPVGKMTYIGADNYYSYACEDCGYMESYKEIKK